MERRRTKTRIGVPASIVTQRTGRREKGGEVQQLDKKRTIEKERGKREELTIEPVDQLHCTHYECRAAISARAFIADASFGVLSIEGKPLEL